MRRDFSLQQRNNKNAGKTTGILLTYYKPKKGPGLVLYYIDEKNSNMLHMILVIMNLLRLTSIFIGFVMAFFNIRRTESSKGCF